MPVYQGTTVTKYINLKDRETDDYLDVSTWMLRAQLRRQPGSVDYLAELTTENGGFVIVDGVNGRIAMVLDDTLTDDLPVGRVHFDVLRMDASEGPLWVFGGSFIVKQPITR